MVNLYVQGKLKAVELMKKRVGSNATLGDKKLPPGQREVAQMVAMPPITESYPVITKLEFTLHLYGTVEKELTFTWDELLKLGTESYQVDFHCVTRWSKFGQNFTGVDFKKIIKLVKPLPETRFVIFESYDNYTTNLVYQELVENTAFIATQMGGADIGPKFGGPARMVVPHLYGWKSAKFLKGIRFQNADEPGFWERYGYHNHADPWLEERYSP